MLNLKTNQLPWKWLILSFGVAVFDQCTKSWAIATIQPQTTTFILPFLLLHLGHNPGVGFGLFSQLGKLLILVTILSMLNVIHFMHNTYHPQGEHPFWVSLGFSLILGGGLGNLYDRCTAGAVTDFMSIYLCKWWIPLFNFSDLFITIGLMCIYVHPVCRVIARAFRMVSRQ